MLPHFVFHLKANGASIIVIFVHSSERESFVFLSTQAVSNIFLNHSFKRNGMLAIAHFTLTSFVGSHSQGSAFIIPVIGEKVDCIIPLKISDCDLSDGFSVKAFAHRSIPPINVSQALFRLSVQGSGVASVERIGDS